jgi:hypothetical protein
MSARHGTTDRVRRVTLLVALGVALALTGQSAAATRILAVGDFGVGGATERATGSAMRAWEKDNRANLLLTLGDNDYTQSPAAFRRNWSDSFGWLRNAGVWWRGALGNHDVLVNEGLYERGPLRMPAKYYESSRPGLDIFVLNSNSVGKTQTRWLERRLAASTAKWKIAVFHHPAYSCGGYLSNPAVVSRWVPLFEQYGVNLVLNGHDHDYQRFAPHNGVTYVVHGGGGQELYSLQPCPAGYPARAFGSSSHGFLSIVVGDSALRVRSVNMAGHVIDNHLIYP